MRGIHLVLGTLGVIRVLDVDKVLIAEFAEEQAVGSVLL
jgi:hypothetical protein